MSRNAPPSWWQFFDGAFQATRRHAVGTMMQSLRRIRELKRKRCGQCKVWRNTEPSMALTTMRFADSPRPLHAELGCVSCTELQDEALFMAETCSMNLFHSKPAYSNRTLREFLTVEDSFGVSQVGVSSAFFNSRSTHLLIQCFAVVFSHTGNSREQHSYRLRIQIGLLQLATSPWRCFTVASASSAARVSRDWLSSWRTEHVHRDLGIVEFVQRSALPWFH